MLSTQRAISFSQNLTPLETFAPPMLAPTLQI